jgi:hypothetical protein
MSMFYTPSDMAFLPEEDVATIPLEERQSLVEAGVLSPSQPGLDAPFTGETLFIPRPREDTGGGGTGGGGTGGGGTGGGGGETEAERIARLDREQAAAQFAATQAAEAAAVAQRRQNAFSLIETFLTKAGLTGLEKNVRELLGQGIEDSDSILFRLRDTEQFRTRFKANTARAKQGLPELDPATYIGLEQAYRETLIANNFDKGFYDDQDDFNKLIEGNVSLAEFQARINEGYRKVADADPEVIRQMEQLYGVGKSELAEYFIDPQRARPLLTSKELARQAQAAQVAARGRELAGMQLTATSAEDLIARGFSPEEAQQAFTRQGQLSGLYQEMGGEEMLSEQEKLGATFGFDLTAQEKLERRKAQRLGEFQAGGQFARTTGATSGAIETGLGTAQ